MDTSALVAVFRSEAGFQAMLDAMLTSGGLIPAPVMVEFRRVTAGPGNVMHPEASLLLDQLWDAGLSIEPFTAEDAQIASLANERYGTGNRRGGRLNMLDLMVYAMARRTGRPILCTGTDFQSTDAAIHEASRTW